MKRRLSILLLMLMLCLNGCGKEKKQPDLQAVQDAGVLKVGVTVCEPYCYQENGQWSGFDVALANAIGQELGVKTEFVELEWSARWPSLREGSVDCVVGCITATDALAEQVDLSQSYLASRPVLVVTAETAKRVGFAGERIAAEEGSACALAAEACLGSVTVVPTQGQTAALDALASGEVTGAVADLIVAQARAGDGLSIRMDLELGTQELKMALRYNSDLTVAFNDALNKLQSSGELDRLAEEYGVKEWLVMG